MIDKNNVVPIMSSCKSQIQKKSGNSFSLGKYCLKIALYFRSKLIFTWKLKIEFILHVCCLFFLFTGIGRLECRNPIFLLSTFPQIYFSWDFLDIYSHKKLLDIFNVTGCTNLRFDKFNLFKYKEKEKKHLNLSRTLINTSLYFMYTSNALPLHLQYTSMELCRIKRKSKNC